MFTEKCGYLLLYVCETEEGSSGGLILKATNGKFEIVGLHRGGCENHYNFGSKFSAILDSISGVKDHDKCSEYKSTLTNDYVTVQYNTLNSTLTYYFDICQAISLCN